MSSMTPADVDLERELIRMARRIRRMAMQTAAHLHPDLDYSTYLYFVAICDAPVEVRSADLAEQLDVHKSTASRAVSALVRFGLVTQMPDPLDGRARLLVPEPAAVERLRERQLQMHRRFGRLLVGWSENDVREFTTTLRRFNDSAEALP